MRQAPVQVSSLTPEADYFDRRACLGGVHFLDLGVTNNCLLHPAPSAESIEICLDVSDDYSGSRGISTPSSAISQDYPPAD